MVRRLRTQTISRTFMALTRVPVIVISITIAILSGAKGSVYVLITFEVVPSSSMGSLMSVQHIVTRLRVVKPI